MKEIFDKKQEFFCGLSQKNQRKQGNGADPQEKSGQKPGQTPSWPSEDQKVEHRAQHQDQRHEQPQTAVSHRKAQKEQSQGGQEAEQQIRKETGAVQPQPLPQSGGQVVYQSELGTADQGTEGLQSLPSGIQAHQPRSLPKKLRRPGEFSA